jgi:transforming growth factor-beta-induced protein
VTADQVVNLSSAKTINGCALQISSMEGKVMVDNARVTATDIMASNGFIHVLDSVVLP